MTKRIVSFRNFSDTPVSQAAFFVPGKRCYHPTGDKCSRNCFILLLTLCYALSVAGAGHFSSSVLWTGRSENRCNIPRGHNIFDCFSKPPDRLWDLLLLLSSGCSGFLYGSSAFFPLQFVISVVHNDGRLRKTGAQPPRIGHSYSGLKFQTLTGFN